MCRLSQAYECLAILEGTSSMAQQALEKNVKLKRDDTRNISAYFNKVCTLQHLKFCWPKLLATSKASR
jgi:hypothetical protein